MSSGQICGQIFGQIFAQIFDQVCAQVFLGQKVQCTVLLGLENAVYSSTGTENNCLLLTIRIPQNPELYFKALTYYLNIARNSISIEWGVGHLGQ